MKLTPRLSSLIALSLFVVAPASAQDTAPNAPLAAAAVRRTPEQLDQLLGPIALYPDALIALILPATTEPFDVVLAARYFKGSGDPARVDDQPWDDSVKALAHYPAIVSWMDENLMWTRQVGEAFLDQPAEVMKSVQRLRAAARAAGTLVDTPQQQVVAEGDTIVIVPTQPDVIYVPVYDPEVVYVRREYYPGPFLTFSIGYPVGFWLGYDLDWNRRRLWVVDQRERERYWRDHREWRQPLLPSRPDYERDPQRHAWNPNPVSSRPSRAYVVPPHQDIVRPAPFSREPQHPSSVRDNTPVRRDWPPGSREQPRPSPDDRRFAPRRPENIPSVRTPVQVQPPTVQPLTPPAQLPHGNPGPERDDRGGRENRGRFGPQGGAPVNAPAPAAGVLIPPPAQPNMTSPQQSAAPSNAREHEPHGNATSPQQTSPANRQNHPPAPAAPQAAPAAPQPTAVPHSDDKDDRRGHQSERERSN